MLERFLRQIVVQRSGGFGGRPCWLWQGSLSRGYGRFYQSGQHSQVPAHRWAYEYWIGPITKGLQIDHLCRVRACVNPAHLEAVTAQVNILRGQGTAARNARKTHCPSGHRYTMENTLINKGKRYCRACDRDRKAKQRAA